MRSSSFVDALSLLSSSFRDFLLMLLLLLPIAAVHAAPFDFCYQQLQRAAVLDSNALQLSTDELRTTVLFLSGGAATLNDATLAALEAKHATVVASITVNNAALQAFCGDLMLEVLRAQTVLDVAEAKCMFAMQIGDANRDGFLQQSIEFPRYANQVSGNQYGFTTPYSALPVIVQNVFTDFADTSTALISIVGARSTDPDLTETQRITLMSLCYHTAIAILASSDHSGGNNVPPPAPPPPVAAPVAPPNDNGGGGDFTPSFTYTICTRMISFSDVSRDDTLSADEYFNLCNRLVQSSGDGAVEYTGGYANLPEPLRLNFDSLAVGGSINVYGSKPAQQPTAEDTARLTQICTDTDRALQSAPPSEAQEEPPATGGGDQDPEGDNDGDDTAIPFDQCKLGLIFSDLSRDSFLTENEYVRFVSRNDETIERNSDFASLKPSLQDNFHSLAGSDGRIDVTGSKPNQTPTAAQQEHLRRICAETGAALASPNPPTSAPTSLVSGSVTVYNSFVISNSERLRADIFQPGQADRDALDAAYTVFVPEAAANHTIVAGEADTETPPDTRRALFLRQRRLPATDLNTPEIYALRNSNCPSYVTGGNAYCQTVFGSFQVDFVDEPSEDVVLAKLTQSTQNAILPLLQNTLLSIKPDTAIRIEGPSEPLEPVGARDPNFVDPDGKSDSHSSGASAGQILAGVVMGLAVVVGGFLYYQKKHGGSIPTPAWLKGSMEAATEKLSHTPIPGMGNGHPMHGPVGVESALNQPGGGLNGDQASGSEYDDEHEQNGRGGDGSGEFSVEDEHNGADGGKKKGFRPKQFDFMLGNKKDKNIDPDIRVLEGDDDFADGNDFINYSFEEPPEMKHKHDGDDSFLDWGGKNAWGGATTTEGGEVQTTSVADVFDDTFHNNDEDDSHSGSGSDSSGSGSGSLSKGSVVSGVEDTAQLTGLVDNGKWSGVMETATLLDSNLGESSDTSNHSDGKSFSGSRSESASSFTGGNDGIDDILSNSSNENSVGYSGQSGDPPSASEERKRRIQYREQIIELVKKTAPGDIDKVNSMMEQFAGREAELISTLQTMMTRSNSKRRLKVVHRSKGIPSRSASGVANRGAEGSAVVAAASMMYGAEDPSDSRGDGSYSDEGSYYDGGDYGYDDDPVNDNGSFAGSRSGSHSYSQAEGSYTPSYTDHEGSYRSGSGSYRQEGSYSGGSGSYSQEGSYTGPYHDDEGSFSRSRSGSGSYSQEGGSYTGTISRGSGSYSQKGSYTEPYNDNNDDGSFAGSRSGSGSHSPSYNDQEGSYRSGSGSFSQEGGHQEDDGTHSDSQNEIYFDD